MSNFLKDIKQTFSAPKQEPDETSKATLEIENKKRTITQASNNEQNVTREKIAGVFMAVGETSYKLHTEDAFDLEKILGMFETIKELNQSLDEKQTKLNEILSRYDEELKILRAAQPGGQMACSNCGAAYTSGETIFCTSCGNKVPENNTAESVFVNQSACPKCNATLIYGSVFCAGCGNKL